MSKYLDNDIYTIYLYKIYCINIKPNLHTKVINKI